MSRRAVLAARRRRGRRRLAALVLVAALLAAPVYSYASMALQPSSLPLGVRSVDWLRLHHGAWIVNEVERLYYSWKAPKKGGPQLRTLPKVGQPVRVKAATPPAKAAAKPARARPVKAAQPPYVPPRIAPLLRPALPGEGVWRTTGRVVDGAPPVLVTTFRTDPDYPRLVAYVAWFDHTRTQLALYPGRYEPPGASPRGPMEVPQAERWRLLAVFNSGFMHRDSGGGFYVNGDGAEPLQAGQGTLVAYKSGRVDIVAWHGGDVPGHGVVLARQNLPLIIDHGRLNPQLADGSLWGSTLGNAVRVWRTGVGIDRRGNLIYLAADYQTAQSLAEALAHAGAVRAIELDINPEWPTLVTYGHGGVGNATRVVPNYQQPADRYLVPDDRDFFAIYRRTTAAALRRVPFG